MDEVARDGFTNMAMDEWLLESASRPVLRVYGWEEGWGSYGYFVPDQEAERALPEMKRVRRRTGGGIVDHRADWTYTLAVPAGESLVEMRGGGSYRVIHGALAEALAQGGVPVRLSAPTAPARGGECFVRAVQHDLVDAQGRKIAGAGQRRTGHGLLHQGSVAFEVDGELGRRLAARLASEVGSFGGGPDDFEIERRARRYRDPAWASRR